MLLAKPDRPTVPLAPPLRILLAAASPSGWPPTDITKEADATKEALNELVANRMVVLDQCDSPTLRLYVRDFWQGCHEWSAVRIRAWSSANF